MSGALFPPATFPTLAGFTSVLSSEVGLDPSVIAFNQTQIQTAFRLALHWVYGPLARIDLYLYGRAVYCLATDRFISIAQDDPSIYADCPGPMAKARSNFGATAFTPGVINSASDNGTAGSITVSDSLKNLSLADLQNLKTPWGREYLSIAQQLGPIWGLSW